MEELVQPSGCHCPCDGYHSHCITPVTHVSDATLTLGGGLQPLAFKTDATSGLIPCYISKPLHVPGVPPISESALPETESA